MKKTFVLCACALALTACGNEGASNNTSTDTTASNTASNTSSGDQQFTSKSAKRSYALGMDIGNSLKDLPMNLDLDQLTQGVRDVVGQGPTRISQDELQTVMQGVVSDMQAAQQKEQNKEAQANMKAGQEFLAENKKKDGVKTLEDGLQYKVIEKGDGPQPDANDSVTVRYTGKLIDGTVFDSSEERGKPVTFPVNAVIPGWTEALQMMHAGGQYKLFIPPDLAYGERGAGAKIGPNETLIFDVTLVSVDKNKGTGEDSDSADSTDSANSGQ
ncbi:MAG: hypothetical protein CMP08_02920 [Xanthomonadales bacterium]|nr:hypothetical protein [Xanthomonadales bacterium]